MIKENYGIHIDNKKKIGIFIADSNGRYPVPASKGGAVSILVEHLLKENSIMKVSDMTVITYYDEEAEELSYAYKDINFVWVKVPNIIKNIDVLVFNLIKRFFKRKKAISYKSVFSLIYYIFFSKKYLKNNIYDKIVIENNILLSWIIRLSNYKGEYYYHLHNVPRINAKCEKILKNCTGYLCVSQFLANEISSKKNPIGPIDNAKIKVLHNCIDTKIFKPINNENVKIKFKNKFGIQEKDKVIIFAGRLSREKGIDVLLRAAKLVKYPNIKLLIIGSYIHKADVKDEYQKELYDLAKCLGNKVIFTGYIEHSELSIIYNLADVAVFPSVWDEPAGLTMIEAMACGVPVITTQSGGIPEYNRGVSIILQINEFLSENIAINIDNILNDIELSLEMKKMGIKHIQNNFCTKFYLENFITKLNIENT